MSRYRQIKQKKNALGSFRNLRKYIRVYIETIKHAHSLVYASRPGTKEFLIGWFVGFNVSKRVGLYEIIIVIQKVTSEFQFILKDQGCLKLVLMK